MQAKYECALKHPEVKIVTPDWILDSIEADKKLGEESYHPDKMKGATENQISDMCNGLPSIASPRAEEKGEAASSACTAAPPAGDERIRLSSASPAHATKGAAALLSGSRDSTDRGTGSGESSVAALTSHPVEDVGESAEVEGQGSSVMEIEEEVRGDPSEVAGLENLLDGVVIFFTDYQDCVEDETMEKWKMVSVCVCFCLSVCLCLSVCVR